MKPKILSATQDRVECELHANHPVRLIAAAGRRVHCIEGIAWITAYNQPYDVFLKPGQTYVVPNGGLVLAEAIGRCRVRVDLPGAFDYSQAATGLQRVVQELRALRLLWQRRKPA
jgi:hypothetical protein